MNSEQWTVSRVAAYLGIHRVTVNRIPCDQLPYRACGKRKIRYYDSEVVIAYGAGCVPTEAPSVLGMLTAQSRELTECQQRLDSLEQRLQGLSADDSKSSSS